MVLRDEATTKTKLHKGFDVDHVSTPTNTPNFVNVHAMNDVFVKSALANIAMIESLSFEPVSELFDVSHGRIYAVLLVVVLNQGVFVFRYNFSETHYYARTL